MANLSQAEAPLHVDDSPSAVDKKIIVANMNKGSFGKIKPFSFVPTHFGEMSENDWIRIIANQSVAYLRGDKINYFHQDIP